MQLVKLLPDEEGIASAEQLVAEAAQADETGKTGEDVSIPLEELAGAPERPEELANQIVSHFKKQSEVIDGKGMIVCMSRDTCMDLHDKIVALRPEWHDEDGSKGAVKVVMDANVGKRRPGESKSEFEARRERTKYHGRTKARREKLGSRIKNPADSLNLAIVSR